MKLTTLPTSKQSGKKKWCSLSFLFFTTPLLSRARGSHHRSHKRNHIKGLAVETPWKEKLLILAFPTWKGEGGRSTNQES